MLVIFSLRVFVVDVRLVSGYEYEQNMTAVSVRPAVRYMWALHTAARFIFKNACNKADCNMIHWV